jgi:AcrR family transcriptional regulator
MQRGDLTLQLILDAALRLADREGPDAVTMRRVGEEIGVSAMALYWHVDSRQELITAVVDYGFGVLSQDAGTGLPWHEQLRTVFVRIHDALLEHPALIALLSTQPHTGARAMRVGEPVFAALEAAGFDDDKAVEVIASLQSYAFGSAIRQRARAALSDDAIREQRREFPVDRYPRLYGLADARDWASEHQFEQGLEWLLGGIRAAHERSVADHPDS